MQWADSSKKLEEEINQEQNVHILYNFRVRMKNRDSSIESYIV